MLSLPATLSSAPTEERAVSSGSSIIERFVSFTWHCTSPPLPLETQPKKFSITGVEHLKAGKSEVHEDAVSTDVSDFSDAASAATFSSDSSLCDLGDGAVCVKTESPRSGKQRKKGSLEKPLPPRNSHREGFACRVMGESRASLGRYDEAIKLYSKSLSMLQEEQSQQGKDLLSNSMLMSEPSSPTWRELDRTKLALAETHICIGSALEATGQFYEAILELDAALRLQKGVLGSHHVQVSKTLHKRAIVLRKRNLVQECIESLKEAVVIAKRLYDSRKTEDQALYTAKLFLDLGTVYHQQRNFEEAVRMYNSSWTMYQAAGLEDRSSIIGEKSGKSSRSSHPEMETLRRRLKDKNIYAVLVARFWNDENGV